MTFQKVYQIIAVMAAVVIFHFPIPALADKYIDKHIFQKQINELKANNNGFMIFDLNISDKEMALLNKIEIKNTLNYNRFGDLNLIHSELPNFLKEVTTANDNEIEIITHLIAHLSTDVVKATGEETAWITLRASIQNHDYDVHRWHTDGYFFIPTNFPSDRFQYKFATTLKGDPTLFYPLPEKLREDFSNTQDNRVFWSKKLDPALAISAQIGQGSIFTVGDSMRSAVHSEPRITQDRLFFSVVVGTHEQISALHQRWNKRKE